MVPDSTPDEIEEVEEVEEVIEEQPDDEATVVAQLPLDVIEEAVGYGLTSKEIEQLGSEDNIAAVLQIIDRRHDDTTEEVQSEATVGDDPDDPFADPEENTGVNSEVAERLGKVLGHLTPGRDLESPTGEPEYRELDGLDERARALAAPLLERQRRFHRARRQLQDSDNTGFLFVLTPERLPILETARAVASLRDARIPVSGMIVNRVLPAGVEGEFFRARRQREGRLLEEIEQRLGSVPKLTLPLLADDIQGRAALEDFAASFQSGP